MTKHSWKTTGLAMLALSLVSGTALAQSADGATVAFLMPDQASTRYEEHDYLFADRQRKSGIRMQNRAVLNIRPRANRDQLVVAAQNRAEPYAGVFFELHLAEQHRVRSDPERAILRRSDALPIQLVECHP